MSLFYIGSDFVQLIGPAVFKSGGHQGALATPGRCQVGGGAEERLVHCGSCVKG